MFRNMYHQVKEKFLEPSLALKSRNGFLSATDQLKLDSIIDSAAKRVVHPPQKADSLI